MKTYLNIALVGHICGSVWTECCAVQNYYLTMNTNEVVLLKRA